jgi:hypothetical protein
MSVDILTKRKAPSKIILKIEDILKNSLKDLAKSLYFSFINPDVAFRSFSNSNAFSSCSAIPCNVFN